MAKMAKQARVHSRVLTSEDLDRERASLLRAVGMSEAKLRSRAQRNRLSAHERVVLGDLDDLQWLMA